MSFLDNLWYGKSLSAALIRVPLLPFSAVFGVVSAFRRSLYANGFLKQTGPVVPVVVVGGITVGGTGKTPTVIALVNELKDRGFKPGVLTRGYKAQCPIYPSQVPMDADPVVFGDEPALIRRSTGVPVVIDPVRTRGADYLAGLDVDVIITDDGMQHYALEREVEICVLDGSRMLGNGHLLPAGPLREAEWRLKTVSSIVVSGAVAQLGHTPMMLRPSAITALNPDNNTQLDHRGEVTALCGIGNPDRFYKTLEDCGFNVVEKVEVGDHNKLPFDKLQELASKRTVIMTAKDAIKYRREAKENNLENAFVLNVAAQLSNHFFDDIVGKIKLAHYRVDQRRKKREAEGYVLQKIESIDDSNVAADGENIVKTAARLSAEQQNAELAKARLKAAIEADAKKAAEEAAAAEAAQQPLWVPSVPSMAATSTPTIPAAAAEAPASTEATASASASATAIDSTAAAAAIESADTAAASTDATSTAAAESSASAAAALSSASTSTPLWVPSVPSAISSHAAEAAAEAAAMDAAVAAAAKDAKDEVAAEASETEAQADSATDATAAAEATATTTTTRSRRKTADKKESAKDKAEDEESTSTRKTTKRTTKSSTTKTTTTRKKSTSTAKSKAVDTADADAAASASSDATTAAASESATSEKEESATKTTARKTVRKTTRTSDAKDGKDIFSLKKMRNNYDPNALPKELKRKTPKTKAATEAAATKTAATAAEDTKAADTAKASAE